MVVLPLEIEIRPLDGAQELSVLGELDLATAPALAERLDELGVPGSPRLIVDLAGLSFIDVCGLRVLVDAHERLNRSGYPGLWLARPSPSVRRLFDLTWMSRFLPPVN